MIHRLINKRDIIIFINGVTPSHVLFQIIINGVTPSRVLLQTIINGVTPSRVLLISLSWSATDFNILFNLSTLQRLCCMCIIY